MAVSQRSRSSDTHRVRRGPRTKRYLVASLAVAALTAVVVGTAASRDAIAVIAPDAPEVHAAEADRRDSDAPVVDVQLAAAPTTVDLGGREATTWAFNGQVPGPEIRVPQGGVVRATVSNDLPQPLTIHWHGLALRNDMDGVPELTQEPIPPGETSTYEFTAPDSGTFFYHPHTGTQLDRGLYGPLVVEASSETGMREAVVILDDWLDGSGRDPDGVLEQLRSGGSGMEGMSGMDHGAEMSEEAPEATSEPGMAGGPLGDDTGDVDYPMYLANGRPPTNPAVIDAVPGEPLRLRVINAGSDTPFRIAVGGTAMTVTHTDGFPVEPVTVDTLLMGMGERYDVTVTLPAAGSYPLVAIPEGKSGQALAVLRAGSDEPERAVAAVRPVELDGRLLNTADLHATADVALPSGPADRTYRLALTGSMSDYRWAVERADGSADPLTVRTGEKVRLVFENRTTMWHPMHLHGVTFQVVGDSPAPGPRKDTLIVPAMGAVTVEFVADNPGQWALHCHNVYHAEAGMQTVVSYVR